MKAAVIHQIGAGFKVENVRLDSPREREVVVEVKAAGLCHSDLTLAENDFGNPLPMVLGHELSGVVLETGDSVAGLSPGDHVVGSLVQSCGECPSCRHGHGHRCEHPEETLREPGQAPRITIDGAPAFQGYGLGAFAEHVLAHENQLVRVPDSLPFPQAALLGCGVITGMGAAINTADIRPGSSVVVIGTGGVGLNVIAGARLAGSVQIVAVDLNPAKLKLAVAFGATHTIDSRGIDSVAVVRELTGGGADHVFEVIGLRATSEQAVQMARRGGAAYLVGLHKPDARIEVNPLMDLIRGQKKIQGVFMGSADIAHDIPLYAELYLQGRLMLDDLVSQEIRLEEINDAYRQLASGTVARSVITAF